MVLALGAAACLGASSASAQMVIGESQSNVEINWSVLDKLGPEPTLPGLLTRKVAPPAKPKPITKQGVAFKPYGKAEGPAMATVAKPPKPAKIAVEKISAPEPVAAPQPAPVVAKAPVMPKAPVEAYKADAIPGVPPAEKVTVSAQPPKPPKVEVANEVAPPAKAAAEPKVKAAVVPPTAPAVAPEKPAPAPSAVQFVKAPEPPPAPPPAPVVVAAPPPPPPPPVPAPVVAPAPPVVAAPPVPVVQPPSVPPQQLAAMPPPAPASIRKGDNASVIFALESSHLPDGSRGDLDRIAQKMERDEAITLQLLAYAAGDEANASKARRLSLSRALEVRKYLMEMGVRSTRIEVRALGNKIEGSPADRVDVVMAVR
ncbi:OmpA family protein [Paramagnetospirillum kuznetsovii]|nr:OmpA family protein [Paramagnetospirillum kuznetsovii]